MKIATVLGTRPEIIRLSVLIEKLDGLVDHTLVHTGQNFDVNLSDAFFRDLGVRAPDFHLGIASGNAAEQIARILVGVDEVLGATKPDRLLILGDTNSGLAAIVAKRRGIPVYHMEAGNRCFDDRVPEEVNRRIIDHCSDILMPYTERSRDNLLREGIASRRIYVTGNPIKEIIDTHAAGIEAATALADLGLDARRYFLVTLHRAENVDNPERLGAFMDALSQLARNYGFPIIVSTHPRTRSRVSDEAMAKVDAAIRFLDPFGFHDFIKLERNAFCVLSDSGTVQEECALFGVPNVTLRDVTERPETIECGSNFLSGLDVERILHGVHLTTSRTAGWRPPPEYLVDNVSDVVLRIITGYQVDGLG